MQAYLPPVFAVDEQHGKSFIRQLAKPEQLVTCTVATFQSGRKKYSMLRSPDIERPIILTTSRHAVPDTQDDVLQIATDITGDTIDLRAARWIRHPLLCSQSAVSRSQMLSRIRDSWIGSNPYLEAAADGQHLRLREPQLGALHAIRAHWTVSTDVATVVMPTGTGKTDTMLAAMVTERCEHLLVVVPTDALRTQLAEKFLSLGILKIQGSSILDARAEYPVVCILSHKPKSKEESDTLFRHAHITITTSAIAGACPDDVQSQAGKLFTHLFVDEAHHAEAPTWKRFKDALRGSKILQFTATPFRDDDQPIDGRIIYNYPLRRAQERGYFRPIRFRPVIEFSPKRSDSAIAEAAIAQLRQDASLGHILMARVSSIHRAKEVFSLYSPHSEFNPVQLHTGLSASERKIAKDMLLTGRSRVVVCVDMLGEGFDLPELKIAAFHDIRKSLPVTLQLAGRFTRARPGLGNATFIANVAEVHVNAAIQKLYSQDPDWNELLPDMAEKVVKEQIDLHQFLKDFSTFSTDVPLRTVEPAASCVAYKTRCMDWNPSNYRDGIPGIESAGQVYSAVNNKTHTLVVATVSRSMMDWTHAEAIFGLEWQLYVAHWDHDQRLLYINASANTGNYNRLAKALCGDDVALVDGDVVFRVFGNINRLTLNNVGLTEVLGRNVRYTGRMGADVETGLGDHTKQKATKSVLAGAGFSGGSKVTIGASKGGRVWSKQRLRLHSWVSWCKNIGSQLVDDSIDTSKVLAGTLQATIVVERPPSMPIAVEWPETVWQECEALWHVRMDGKEVPLGDVSINLVEDANEGGISFAAVTETTRADFVMRLMGTGAQDARFTIDASGGVPAQIRRGNRAWQDMSAFLMENPPTVWFADGGALEGNRYVNPSRHIASFPSDAIRAVDWSNVDIRRESQGLDRDATTVQGRMMQLLAGDAPDILVDDDGAGEAADIVVARMITGSDGLRQIQVDLYHCKYSSEGQAGSRLKDLYEVCGQAQRSVHWKNSEAKGVDLFTHILRRDASRMERDGVSRFCCGDADKAIELRQAAQTCPMNVRVHIVQPGLSRGRATQECLHLLGVTKTYLFETYQVELTVHASA